MKALSATLAGLALAVGGFAGAQALAAEPPPLVANCVNAAEDWTIEVVGFDCVQAAKIVRRLAVLAPKAPIRLANMTCTVGYARKLAIAVRCAGGGGRFVRANLRPRGGKATPLPPLLRCPDYVDSLRRRWAIRSERFGCLDAADIVAQAATARLTAQEVKWLQREWNVGCWINEGLARLIRCWRTFTSGHFYAYVKPAPTPNTTAAVTETVERP